MYPQAEDGVFDDGRIVRAGDQTDDESAGYVEENEGYAGKEELQGANAANRVTDPRFLSGAPVLSDECGTGRGD